MTRGTRPYWNMIPNHIVGIEDGDEMLKAWGFEFWGNSKDLVYTGWQRVHLPHGWSIELCGESKFSLLDNKDQLRGEIYGAFQSSRRKIEFEAAIKEAFDLPNAGVDQEPGPQLAIKRCISIKQQISLAECGPHTIQVLNAYSEPIFEIRDFYKADHEWDDAEKLVTAWLQKHYPEWESPHAYWDLFT